MFGTLRLCFVVLVITFGYCQNKFMVKDTKETCILDIEGVKTYHCYSENGQTLNKNGKNEYKRKNRCELHCFQNTTRRLFCQGDNKWSGNNCKDEKENEMIVIDESSRRLEPHIRNRRFLSWIVAAVSAVATIVTSVVSVATTIYNFYCLVSQNCQKQGPSIAVDRVPPTFEFCPQLKSPIYTPKFKDKIKVSWDEPRANDKSSVKIISSPSDYKPGILYGHGDYTIIYTAMDESGNVAEPNCKVKFKVIVRQCTHPYLGFPVKVSCKSPLLYGNKCTFSCATGYNLVGDAVQICTEAKKLSGGGSITCSLKQCLEPPVPANAAKDKCTDGRNYNSICIFRCKHGYSFPQLSDVSVKCNAHQQWIGSPSDCIDVASPVIKGCPSHITRYADKRQASVTVSWINPTAIDNHDGPVAVKQTQGPPPGSVFSASQTYTITYSSKDAAGNGAIPCQFTVLVKQTRCSSFPYTRKMNITCPDGLIYGSVCHLQCEPGYPLVGSSTATCDRMDTNPINGFWNYGENTTASKCEEVPCEPLNTPRNGAKSCGTWVKGFTCTMSCNENYDIPRTVTATELFSCNTQNGIWMPSQTMPDCSEKRRVNIMRLPSEMYYYSGNCSSSATQQQIKLNFIQILNTTKSALRAVCTDYKECSADNVEVKCGKTTKKKKVPTATLR